MKRTEVAEQHKWNMNELYATPEAFEQDYARAEQLVSEYPKHEATMLGSPAEL